RCVNCKGQHSSTYKGCPAYARAKEICHIKATNHISYAEATKIFKDRPTIPRDPPISLTNTAGESCDTVGEFPISDLIHPPPASSSTPSRVPLKTYLKKAGPSRYL